ncbi:MAG: mono/diheme cytochrome c family protein [Vicingaceae bacterium]|jgi:mono/diheme cytochrome c family protein
MKRIINTIFMATIGTMFFVACEDPQSPGLEYMPDMYRSPAIEIYVDYEFPDSSTARKAPIGSIPQGYKPYAYPNTNEGYEMAGQQLSNPLLLTEKTIKEGQKLYTSFCAHCHGKKGLGKGSIQNAIYGAVPSYADETPNRRGNRSMKELTEGHIYHTIMFGLNAMGPHSSLIRENDRWEIVAYVQTLQGKDPLANKTEQPIAEIAE